MIVTTAPRAIGYKLIARGRVHEAHDLAELADRLAECYAADTAARAKARTSLTRDRELTEAERRELIALATDRYLAAA